MNAHEACVGDPKAIPWTHLTPIRAAVDAWAQMDVREGETMAWPTNLGWMMGPFLIYAALFSGATIALFNVSHWCKHCFCIGLRRCKGIISFFYVRTTSEALNLDAPSHMHSVLLCNGRARA